MVSAMFNGAQSVYVIVVETCVSGRFLSSFELLTHFHLAPVFIKSYIWNAPAKLRLASSVKNKKELTWLSCAIRSGQAFFFIGRGSSFIFSIFFFIFFILKQYWRQWHLPCAWECSAWVFTWEREFDRLWSDWEWLQLQTKQQKTGAWTLLSHPFLCLLNKKFNYPFFNSSTFFVAIFSLPGSCSFEENMCGWFHAAPVSTRYKWQRTEGMATPSLTENRPLSDHTYPGESPLKKPLGETLDREKLLWEREFFWKINEGCVRH